MDTGQLYSTRTPVCLWLSTVPLEDTISCDSPLARSVPKTSSRKRVPRMYWNHRQHHRAQLHWGRTWCPPTRPYAYCLQIQLGVQPPEDTCEGSSCQFLWLPLQCQWSPPRPRQGQCCTCLASTHQHHWTPRILRSSHIPKSLHTWSVHLDCPFVRAAQEEHRLHMELHLWHHIWVDQGSCHQWHHPKVLWPITSSNNTGWCLTGRPWCSTPV